MTTTKTRACLLLLAALATATRATKQGWRLIQHLRNYADARDFCQQNYGAGLAIIRDQAENDAMFSAIRASTSSVKRAYFGYTDRQQEGNFVWDDGQNYNYINWQQGQPNSYGGNEDCAEIGYFDEGKWNDRACELQSFFFCDVREYEEQPAMNRCPEREVVFLMDSSQSVGRIHFGTQKQWVRDCLPALATNGTGRVGYIRFSRWADTFLTLEDSRDMSFQGWKRQLAAIPFRTGWTATRDALDGAIAMFEGSTSRSKVVIMFTDGKPWRPEEQYVCPPTPEDEDFQYAQQLAEQGICLYVVLIGNQRNQFAHQLSCLQNAAGTNFFDIEDFDDPQATRLIAKTALTIPCRCAGGGDGGSSSPTLPPSPGPSGAPTPRPTGNPTTPVVVRLSNPKYAGTSGDPVRADNGYIELETSLTASTVDAAWSELYVDNQRLFRRLNDIPQIFRLPTAGLGDGFHIVTLNVTEALGSRRNAVGVASVLVSDPGFSVTCAEYPPKIHSYDAVQVELCVDGAVRPRGLRIDARGLPFQNYTNITTPSFESSIADGTRLRFVFYTGQMVPGSEGLYELPITIIGENGRRFLYRDVRLFVEAYDAGKYGVVDGLLVSRLFPSATADDTNLQFTIEPTTTTPRIRFGESFKLPVRMAEGQANRALQLIVGFLGSGCYYEVALPLKGSTSTSTFNISIAAFGFTDEDPGVLKTVQLRLRGKDGWLGPIRALDFEARPPDALLKFEIEWTTLADIDMFVTAPNGHTLSWTELQDNELRGYLVTDWNQQCGVNPDLEETANYIAPVSGAYQVVTNVYDGCGSGAAFPVTLKVEGCNFMGANAVEQLFAVSEGNNATMNFDADCGQGTVYGTVRYRTRWNVLPVARGTSVSLVYRDGSEVASGLVGEGGAFKVDYTTSAAVMNLRVDFYVDNMAIDPNAEPVAHRNVVISEEQDAGIFHFAQMFRKMEPLLRLYVDPYALYDRWWAHTSQGQSRLFDDSFDFKRNRAVGTRITRFQISLLSAYP